MRRGGGGRSTAGDLPPLPARQAGNRRPRGHEGYLYKTATAAIYDRWRKQRRERLWSLAFRFREEAPPTAGTGDVSRCFQKLKPRERALLWLAYVEGYAHGEIAGTLDLNEKSVRVLLFRARRNLERILRQNGLSEVQP